VQLVNKSSFFYYSNRNNYVSSDVTRQKRCDTENGVKKVRYLLNLKICVFVFVCVFVVVYTRI